MAQRWLTVLALSVPVLIFLAFIAVNRNIQQKKPPSKIFGSPKVEQAILGKKLEAELFMRGYELAQKGSYKEAYDILVKSWAALNQTKLDPKAELEVEEYLIVDYLQFCAKNLEDYKVAYYLSLYCHNLPNLTPELFKEFHDKVADNWNKLQLQERNRDCYASFEVDYFNEAFKMMEEEQDWQLVYDTFYKAWKAFNDTKDAGLIPKMEEYLIVDYIQHSASVMGDYEEGMFLAEYCSKIPGISRALKEEFEGKILNNIQKLERRKEMLREEELKRAEEL